MPHSMEGEGIERAQPQCAVCIVFGNCGIAAKGVDMRAGIERGGAGIVQRQRAGDRARRRREIMVEMQDDQGRNGSARSDRRCRGSAPTGHGARLDRVGLGEALAHKARLQAPRP